MTLVVSITLLVSTALIISGVNNIPVMCAVQWAFAGASGTPACPSTATGTTPQASNQAPGSVVTTS